MKINKKVLNQLKELVRIKSYKYFKNKEGYKFLTRSSNKNFFALLNKAGFFILHKSNRKKLIVGLHQVVLFLYKGVQSLALGGLIKKGQMEVHHIDHNPSNNSHHNLEYTTPFNNKAISTIVSICCNSNAGYYNASVKYDLDLVRLFHNVTFCELLVKSIKACSNLLNKDLFKELLFAIPFKQASYIYNTCSKLMYA
jgi:hypothetical protein